jgi:hypothetical protein
MPKSNTPFTPRVGLRARTPRTPNAPKDSKRRAREPSPEVPFPEIPLTRRIKKKPKSTEQVVETVVEVNVEAEANFIIDRLISCLLKQVKEPVVEVEVEDDDEDDEENILESSSSEDHNITKILCANCYQSDDGTVCYMEYRIAGTEFQDNLCKSCAQVLSASPGFSWTQTTPPVWYELPAAKDPLDDLFGGGKDSTLNPTEAAEALMDVSTAVITAPPLALTPITKPVKTPTKAVTFSDEDEICAYLEEEDKPKKKKELRKKDTPPKQVNEAHLTPVAVDDFEPFIFTAVCKYNKELFVYAPSSKLKNKDGDIVVKLRWTPWTEKLANKFERAIGGLKAWANFKLMMRQLKDDEFRQLHINRKYTFGPFNSNSDPKQHNAVWKKWKSYCEAYEQYRDNDWATHGYLQGYGKFLTISNWTHEQLKLPWNKIFDKLQK